MNPSVLSFSLFPNSPLKRTPRRRPLIFLTSIKVASEMNEFERHYGCPAHYFLDSKPRRNAASSSKNLHGKEEDRKRKQKLQPLGADKRVKCGSPKTHCSDAALSDESPSEGKGSSTSGMEESFLSPLIDSDEESDRSLENENGPSDLELVVDHLGWSYMSPEECTRKPQICRIYVEGDSWEESDYIKLLKEIGCDHRFLVCSHANPSCVFFAKLTKSEAAELKGHKKVLQVFMYGSLFFPC